MEAARKVSMDLLVLRSKADDLQNAFVLFKDREREREQQKSQDDIEIGRLQSDYDKLQRSTTNQLQSQLPALMRAAWNEATLSILYSDWKQRLDQRQRLQSLAPDIPLTPLRRSEAQRFYGDWLRTVSAVAVVLSDGPDVSQRPVRFRNTILNDGDTLFHFSMVDGHTGRRNDYFVARLKSRNITVLGTSGASGDIVMNILGERNDILSAIQTSFGILTHKLMLGNAYVLSEELIKSQKIGPISFS